MAYSDYPTKRLVVMVAGIRDGKHITPETRKILLKYVDFYRAKGLSDTSINRNLYCLNTFLKYVGKRDILKLKKDDIEAAMAKVEGSEYSAHTKQHIKVAVKAFYRHFLGDDCQYPREVAWIKTGLAKSKETLPSNLLTEADIKKLLDATTDLRNRTMIAVLYDSGVRIGELLNMRLKDVDLESEPAAIMVSGKTGTRRVPIIFSPVLLSQYMTEIRKQRGPDDFLWKANGSWTNFVPKADYAGIRKMISMTAKKAGLQKRCNPHTFRHSRASFYGNKINEAQLREIFGWSKSSDMPAIYVHLSARNIADAVLVANGLKAKDKTEEKSQLRPTPCPKCCELAPPGASYCAKCGASMDIAVAMAQDAKNELVKQLLKNPAVLKAVGEIQDSMIQKE